MTNPATYSALARQTAETAGRLWLLAEVMDTASFHTDGWPPAKQPQPGGTPMTQAEEKRLEVLRRIQDVLHHATGPRMHDSVSASRSVRPEVYQLLQWGLIESCDRAGEQGYRRTAAGDEYLAAGGAS